jgi:hypothetical protein
LFRFEFYLIDASLDTLDTVMTSTIVINGQARNLSAPPLNIKVRTYVDYDFRVEPPDDSWQSASEFWSNTGASPWQWFEWIVGQDSMDPLYTYNDVLIEEPTVEKTGRCIAEDAYSWGFSSLLLLTFCCYTIAFALALILLQTDIYWNSRHDRDHRSHSIYTDVLYLAEELKNTFGHNIEDHMQSPKTFEKRVERWKQSLRLDVRELPL